MFSLILICLCVFGAIALVCIITFRMKEIKNESNQLNKRLEFWLSEKSNMGEGIGYETEREDKDESFARRVLIPLGEQVGNYMAEKIPYSKQSGVRKLLIKAGYRDKKSFQFFYSIKVLIAILFGGVAFLSFSLIGKDVQAAFGIVFVGGIFGFLIPNFILDKKATNRQIDIDRVLPDALDLLVICTEAGMGIDQSLLRVAANLGNKVEELTEEIIITNREMNLGQERSICWNGLGERTNSEELKNLSRVIVQSEKVGSSIGGVLRSQAEFLRVRRRQKAEETAAKMTIKMMIPMAFFIFPCIMAVTMGPPMLKLMSTFGALGK